MERRRNSKIHFIYHVSPALGCVYCLHWLFKEINSIEIVCVYQSLRLPVQHWKILPIKVNVVFKLFLNSGTWAVKFHVKCREDKETWKVPRVFLVTQFFCGGQDIISYKWSQWCVPLWDKSALHVFPLYNSHRV